MVKSTLPHMFPKSTTSLLYTDTLSHKHSSKRACLERTPERVSTRKKIVHQYSWFSSLINWLHCIGLFQNATGPTGNSCLVAPRLWHFMGSPNKLQQGHLFPSAPEPRSIQYFRRPICQEIVPKQENPFLSGDELISSAVVH